MGSAGIAIRRLGPGDEAALEHLAAREAEYDADGSSPPRPPLDPAAAAAYLANADVLHLAAEDESGICGHILCYVEHRRAGAARQVLLYEIGVRRDRRRRGIGRRLVDAVIAWMSEAGIAAVWVLAGDGAVDFYAACGFTAAADQPLMMRRRVTG